MKPKMNQKKCRICSMERPLKAFPKKARNKDGRATVCNRCQYIRKNLESLTKKTLPEIVEEEATKAQIKLERQIRNRKYWESRDAHLKGTYGMTQEEYESRLQWQGGRCAICNGLPKKGHKNPLHVDHDHNTGLVRGILCSRCNTGIGFFQDSPQVLQSAIDYLRVSSRKNNQE